MNCEIAIKKILGLRGNLGSIISRSKGTLQRDPKESKGAPRGHQGRDYVEERIQGGTKGTPRPGLCRSTMHAETKESKKKGHYGDPRTQKCPRVMAQGRRSILYSIILRKLFLFSRYQNNEKPLKSINDFSIMCR